MASPVFRKLALAGMAVIIAAIVMILSVPLLASTTIIRERITQELGRLTGHRVQIGGAPDISLFPELSVRLSDVRMLPLGGADRVAITADEIQIQLSALSAISGSIDFTSITLVRPVFQLPSGGRGFTADGAWIGGQIGNAVRKTQKMVSEEPGDGGKADMPNRQIGQIVIRDGRIRRSGDADAADLMSVINGQLDWPRLAMAAKADFTAIWNGEQVRLSFSSGQPLLLLAGELSPLDVSLATQPVSMTFAGKAALLPMLRGEGSVMLESPSPDRAVQWLKLPHVTSTDPGPVALTARVQADNERYKLEEATLMIAKGTAKGTAELSFQGGQPLLSGALDFDFINLDTILGAFTGKPPETMQSEEPIEARQNAAIGLDLRLSAAKASLASLEMTELAATAQVKDGLAAFDISDATAFSGVIQAGLRINSGEWPNTGELRLLATEIDGEKVAEAIGLPNRFPRGTGTISLILEGKTQTWRQLLEESSGSFSAKFTRGSVPDLDVSAFRKRVGDKGFFSLASLAGASFPFDVAELETTIAKGTATIQKAGIRNRDVDIRLSGVIPYAGRSLALSGELREPLQQGEDSQAAGTGATDRFFVGGSWASPYFAPVIAEPAPN